MSASRSICPLWACGLALVSCAGSGRPPSPSPTTVGTPTPAPTTTTPATPAVGNAAEHQFAAWLAAFNSADRSQLLAYHDQNFPYGTVADAPPGPRWRGGVANVEAELGLSQRMGGFDLRKIEDKSPTVVVAVLKARHGHQYGLATMEIDPGPGHHVLRFETHPIPTPDEFVAPERVAIQLDAARRTALIDGIADAIQRHYVFPDIGAKTIASLRDHAAHGDYDSITDGRTFMDRVTHDLRDASHDAHMNCVFGRPPPPPSPQTAGDHLAQLRASSFGFGMIERLPGNIAHMALDAFVSPPDDDVQAAIGDFMAQIADADALILDLRHNHGGDPETVAVVASYLFDTQPVHLGDIVVPERGTTVQFWTWRNVRGTRFGGKKPVYILTSRETFSGGEGLAYDLQALKRALVIGETTGGGAHPAILFDLDDWYHVAVPNGRSVNPITKTDWEGIGVVPDVPVAADAALDEAVRRATNDLALTRQKAHKTR